ncbi:hypothetical protein BDY19DRAFT_990060 [Irpex rosettiformis]|uniref:Uncharacterized protein n=1 Tax=Irpex rosettiformis TaxID=378272 RepID=A0ACB8UGE5_9APHY|nr:hypothetical protein BDY19DRAFT_990060 [Irpex rosettiformis]
MEGLADSILPLPDREDGHAWAANIQQACYVIQTTYAQSIQLLRQSDLDPIRLKVHLDTLIDDVCPLLLSLAEVAETEVIPEDWIGSSTDAVGKLGHQMKEAYENSCGRETLDVASIAPISSSASGQRGRPRKTISKAYLQAAMSPS